MRFNKTHHHRLKLSLKFLKCICVFFHLFLFNSRKSSQRAIDELQRSIIDIETKYKAELSRLKKKHETELREYEIQIEALNRNNGELSKANKSLSVRIKVSLCILALNNIHEVESNFEFE